MEEFENKIKERAYLRYINFGCTDEKQNYYDAFAEIIEEMLTKIEFLYKKVNELEPCPDEFFYLNGKEYIYSYEDFPSNEIKEQLIQQKPCLLEFRYPSEYYNESKYVPQHIGTWTKHEEPPMKPMHPDIHEAAKAINDSRNSGYDSSEERDLVFICNIFE